jgi:hypothetical protein
VSLASIPGPTRLSQEDVRDPSVVGAAKRTRTRSTWILMLSVYISILPLAHHDSVDVGIRSALINYRQYICGVAAIAVAAVYGYRGRGTHRAFSSLGLASFLFPAAYCLFALVDGRLSPVILALYLGWAMFAWIATPELFAHRDAVTTFAKWTFVGLTATLVSLALAQFASGRALFTVGIGGDRVGMGFENPNLWMQAIEADLLCLTVWMVLRPERTRVSLLMASWVGAFYLTTHAGSSSFAVGAAALVVFALVGQVRQRAFLARVLAATAALALILLISTSSLGEYDANTSGRITIWSSIVAGSLDKSPPDNALTALTGTDFVLPERNPYGVVRSTHVEERRHSDNTYLSLALDAGVVGLVLFVLPFAVLVRRRPKAPRIHRKLALAIGGGLAIQGAAVALSPSFGNPLTMTGTILVIGLLCTTDDRATEERP